MAITIYKDLNQFSPTAKGKSYIFNENAVYQSVYNLITTRQGERIFYPEYGVALEDELFELNDSITQDRILTIINNAIEIFEPRVTVDKQQSGIEVDPDNYQIKVSLFFTIKGIDDRTFLIQESVSR